MEWTKRKDMSSPRSQRKKYESDPSSIHHECIISILEIALKVSNFNSLGTFLSTSHPSAVWHWNGMPSKKIAARAGYRKWMIPQLQGQFNMNTSRALLLHSWCQTWPNFPSVCPLFHMLDWYAKHLQADIIVSARITYAQINADFDLRYPDRPKYPIQRGCSRDGYGSLAPMAQVQLICSQFFSLVVSFLALHPVKEWLKRLAPWLWPREDERKVLHLDPDEKKLRNFPQQLAELMIQIDSIAQAVGATSDALEQQAFPTRPATV